MRQTAASSSGRSSRHRPVLAGQSGIQAPGGVARPGRVQAGGLASPWGVQAGGVAGPRAGVVVDLLLAEVQGAVVVASLQARLGPSPSGDELVINMRCV